MVVPLMKGIRRDRRFKQYQSMLKDPELYSARAESSLYDLPVIEWDESNNFLVTHPWLVVVAGKIKAYCSNYPLAASIVDYEAKSVLIRNMANDKLDAPAVWIQHAKSSKVVPFKNGRISSREQKT